MSIVEDFWIRCLQDGDQRSGEDFSAKLGMEGIRVKQLGHEDRDKMAFVGEASFHLGK